MSTGYIVETFADAPMRPRAWFETIDDAIHFAHKNFGENGYVTAAERHPFPTAPQSTRIPPPRYEADVRTDKWIAERALGTLEDPDQEDNERIGDALSCGEAQ